MFNKWYMDIWDTLFLIKKEMMVEILNSKIIIKEINNDKNNENDEII